jgi:hypothetical protein
MDDVEFMDVFDPGNDFLEVLSSFKLIKTYICYNIVKKFPALRILHNEEQLPRSFDDLI